MLVKFASMDAVQGLSLTDSLPSWSSFSGPFAIFSWHLSKPSVLLIFLASLVIVSSIRAALLFIAPLSQQKGSLQSVVVVKPVRMVDSTISCEPSPTSSAAKGKQAKKPTIVVPPTTVEKRTTSWCWGLLKWDSLPALPASRNGINDRSMSETERGWQVQQPGRRTGPIFDHPSTFDIIPA